MKIDHYRNHHVPLKIYEHRREAANNKFLSIKYRYTKDKRKTPVAWAKYRSRVASESWETDDRRPAGLLALWGKLRLKALWGMQMAKNGLSTSFMGKLQANTT